ncbi:MAG: ABC transporter permease subunit [Chloroflexi bacterium]|nr:ABC transporter permease subunit [Chloroflexota bacterium]
MWLSSVFARSLRAYRTGILGWGVGMGLVVLSTMASVGSLVSTPQARQQLVALAGSFKWNADVVAVDTVGGYATWKIGIFILLIAVWPVLGASRMLRGEEERGSLDALLCQPRSRARVALEKAAAQWLALLLACLVVGLLALAGGARFGGDFGLADAVLFGLNLALICAVMAGVALLVSQFTLERSTAASWSGGLLLLFVVMDMAHRVMPGALWLSRISPVYYFNLSKPLVPSSGTNAGAMLLLFLLACGLDALAIALFAQRDIGGVVTLRSHVREASPRTALPLRMPERSWALQSVFGRSLAMLALPATFWGIGIAAFGAWMVVVVQQTSAQLDSILASSPTVAATLHSLSGGATLDADLLSTIFVLLAIMLMAFAVTQVSRWAADEEEGRLDLLLATPHSRATVLVGRYVAVASATVAIAVVALAAGAMAAAATGLAIDGSHLAAAMLGMVPLGLLTAALGYLGAGWLRTAADTGLLSFVLLAWFFISFVGPELGWPNAILRLSAFYYYGQPLLHGLQAGSVLGLLAAAAAALVLAVARFSRKDIAV